MVTLEEYHRMRRVRMELQPRRRERCAQCLQPAFGCYCSQIRRFDPGIEFVILIHPIERRKRIATGRMSHLCLENSRMFTGVDFSQHEEVNDLIQGAKRPPVILYPGPRSLNLSRLSPDDRAHVFSVPSGPVIFVIDGTWATAKRMMRLSSNLAALGQICFTPDKPSNFRVRQQPAQNCYSTVEAIHQVIELMGPGRGVPTARREHDILLKIFDRMVEHQLDYVTRARQDSTMSHFRWS